MTHNGNSQYHHTDVIAKIDDGKSLILRENKITFYFRLPEKAQDARFWMEAT